MISIIIRTKNEERWIKSCLKAILKQKVDKKIEIILVDNMSQDSTVSKALEVIPNIKLITIKNYKPGKALNEGIKVSKGDFIVCLSAHCPPVDENWLKNLLRNFNNKNIGGVYGRQIPTSFTSDHDKRDLFLTFGLDKKIQIKDSFFHNANSMIPREVLKKFPFNDEVKNIEDRLWGQEIIKAGYKIIYEPESVVYHYHGIHQNNRRDRLENVVKIMEKNIPEFQNNLYESVLNPIEMEITSIISIRGNTDSEEFSKKLIQRTISSLKESKYINKILVSTEDKDLANFAEKKGAEIPFLRPKKLANEGVRVDSVLKDFLKNLESEKYYPEIIVPLEIQYPFRPKGLFDSLIEILLREDVDTVIAGYPEYRPCWYKDDSLSNDYFKLITDINMPRNKRNPIHIGLPSMGCATYPELIRSGTRLSGRTLIYEIKNPLSIIEIRNNREYNEINSKLLI